MSKPIPCCSIASFADSLARKNSEALSFIPKPRLEQYAREGQILMATENGSPCGFLVYGSGLPTVRIYQACIQYDARRKEHGLALVARLIEIAKLRGAEGIRLRCASDLEANALWLSAGFSRIGTINGGTRRGRTLHIWYLALWPCLPTMEPQSFKGEALL